MNLSNYNPNTRYRDRTKHRVFNAIRLVLGVGILVGIGFFLGKQYSMSELAAYKNQTASLQAERTTLLAEVTDLRGQVQTANTRFESMQETYQQAIPEGPVEELVSLMHQKIDEGVSPERLVHAVSNAQRPRKCTDPETVRFVVSTPSFTGPESSVSIAEDAIVIKGVGASAHNDKGNAEAWYDPTKAVKLTFITTEPKEDGKEEVKKQEVKESVMPFTHAIVLKDKEYRFSAEEGAKSFVKIVYDICDYP